MKREIVIAIIVVLTIGSTGIAKAQCQCSKCKRTTGEKTAEVVTGTAQQVSCATAQVMQTSVCNPPAVPMTAIQATKDTAGTALDRADAAIKSLTGQDR